MEDAREGRRKRLLERKTDRLAFITGQNRTLAQSVPQDCRHTVAAFEEDAIAMETPKNYHNEGTIRNTLKNSCMQEPALKPATNLEANCVSKEKKIEVSSNEHNRARTLENISGQLFTTPMLKTPEVHGGPRATNKAQNVILTTFTHRSIAHSVIVSENIRLCFAFFVAILAVSSCNSLMIGGRLVNNIINFRPLFLVFLTDVTIILGCAFMNQRISQKPENDFRKVMQEDDGSPNDLKFFLEIGQALYKVFGAAIMDCSICAIFMICGIAV